jgi:hypothetical protein
VKKAQAPAQPSTAKTKHKRKVTSAAAVPDVEDEATNETPSKAGASTGPGTLAQAEALHRRNSAVQ